MYDHHFSNFGRPPVPDDVCKDSAQGILGSGEGFYRFLPYMSIAATLVNGPRPF